VTETERSYCHSEQGEYIPKATIAVRAPGASLAQASPVCAMLDTGSTSTYVPRDIAEERELPDAGTQLVGTLDDRNVRYPARLADIRVFHQDVDSTRVLVWDRPEALLGRDVLHRFALIFDGPAKKWRLVP